MYEFNCLRSRLAVCAAFAFLRASSYAAVDPAPTDAAAAKTSSEKLQAAHLDVAAAQKGKTAPAVVVARFVDAMHRELADPAPSERGFFGTEPYSEWIIGTYMGGLIEMGDLPTLLSARDKETIPLMQDVLTVAAAEVRVDQPDPHQEALFARTVVILKESKLSYVRDHAATALGWAKIYPRLRSMIVPALVEAIRTDPYAACNCTSCYWTVRDSAAHSLNAWGVPTVPGFGRKPPRLAEDAPPPEEDRGQPRGVQFPRSRAR